MSPGKEARPCFTQAHPVSGFCMLTSTRSRRGGGAGWQLKPHLPGEADPGFLSFTQGGSPVSYLS